MSGGNLPQLLDKQASNTEARNNAHVAHGTEGACMPTEADNSLAMSPKDHKSAELAQLLFAQIFSSPDSTKSNHAARPLRLPRQRSNNSSSLGPDTPLLSSPLPTRCSPRKRTHSLRYTSDDYNACDEGALPNKKQQGLTPSAWAFPEQWQQQQEEERKHGGAAEAELAAWALVQMSHSQEPYQITQQQQQPMQPESQPMQAAAPMHLQHAARAATAMALQQPTVSPAELQQACLQLAAHFNAKQAALNAANTAAAAVMAGTPSPLHGISLAPGPFGPSSCRAAPAESGLQSAALTTPKRKQARMYTFSEDESVFSREIRAKIPDSTQQAIRQQWQATGRMAVTCGTAGKQGLAGIFTRDPAGKPVIWAPTTTAAAARLGQLVAVGGGSSDGSMVCIPSGYEAMEPKEFEARAGRQGTRNWQLSILLADFCVMSSPKGKAQAVKLGHFVRIVGIPTAKAA